MLKRIFFLSISVVLAISLFPNGACAKENSDFEQKYSFAKLEEEAKSQATAGDRTRLETPVAYKMLWLAFTNVKYEGKSYVMSKEHSDHLKNVAENFEQSIEKYTDGNIDIQIQLEYIDETLNVTKPANKSYVWLDRNAAKKHLENYNVRGNYETVLTLDLFGN